MKLSNRLLLSQLFLFLWMSSFAQKEANDVTTPLHLSKPDYKTPYGAPAADHVKGVLDKVFTYLDAVTPAQFVNRRSGEAIGSLSSIDSNTVFKQGDFRLTSYEWGVTYSGMLLAGEVTGDARYTDYTKKRMKLLADAMPSFNALYKQHPRGNYALRSAINPRALDDAGALCAAMIKTLIAGGNANLLPVIDNFMDCISTKEFRLKDGTFAR